MTLPVLRLPGGNQSSASRCPCVRRIGMRTPVLLCCTFPARGCTWYIGGRMISYGCSRPTDEVGQVVLHGSLGSNPKTPAARTPVVRVLPRARHRRAGANLLSRRATSRRCQQILARPVSVTLQANVTTARRGSSRSTVSAPISAWMGGLWAAAIRSTVAGGDILSVPTAAQRRSREGPMAWVHGFVRNSGLR
jgi:hypothetical protein